MLPTLSVLILAFAVSLDSFTVGLTYGLRSMRMPFKSLLIIAICTASSLTIALLIGRAITKVFSTGTAESLGGMMLVLIGVWVIYQFFRPKKEPLTEEKLIVQLEIKTLGLVIHLLKRPLSADFDRSGTITGIEALFLGIALSLDAFAVGISATMLGYQPLLLAATVTTMSSMFVLLGIKGGQIFSKIQWIHKVSFIPGVLLVFLGFWRM